MRQSLVPIMLMACSLCACGAGSGGSIVERTPPPPPAPPPPDPPKALTSSEEFVAVGIDQRGVYSAESQGWITPSDLVGFDPGDASQEVSISYDAATDKYTLALPRLGEGRLLDLVFDSYVEGRPTGSTGWLVNSSGEQVAQVQFIVPGEPETDFDYSHWGRWGVTRGTDEGAIEAISGLFAYGLETPASGIPSSGTATYEADLIAGSYGLYYYWVEGDVVLRFDFGAGTLAGELSAYYSDYDFPERDHDFGTYQFADTVFSPSSSAYSGSFSQNGALVAGGFFDGNLTGPNAEEIIGRFALPFDYFGNQYSLTGIWVGRR